MSAKILITGAGGYIGSVATYLFLEKGYSVVAVDNFSTGFEEPLSLLKSRFGDGALRVYKADLQKDINEIFKAESDIQAVVHYAANCSVNESMENPQKYFSNNTAGTQNLLTTMLRHDIKKLIFSSTCAVYGEAEKMPIDETHPTNPANPYGASKRMSEEIIEWYGKLVGLEYVILRYFNVCGASDDSLIGDSKNPSVHLIQNAVRGALGIEPFTLTCPEVNTPDKTPIRDYVNVVDLNQAHSMALEYLLKKGESDIFNLGTGKGNSVLEIVYEIEKQTGKTLDLTKGKTRQGEYAKMIADISKVEKTLGWRPTHTLEQSIASLATWYRAHPNGWK